MSLTAPDGSISTYGYDTLNRLNRLANSRAGSFGFGYGALSAGHKCRVLPTVWRKAVRSSTKAALRCYSGGFADRGAPNATAASYPTIQSL
jgi:hypothetical protein